MIAADRVPIVPGILPDGTEESLAAAMAEAHEVLPYIPGTAVVVLHWPPIEGFERLRDAGFDEAAIAHLRGLLAEHGPAAEITVAMRLAHEALRS